MLLSPFDLALALEYVIIVYLNFVLNLVLLLTLQLFLPRCTLTLSETLSQLVGASIKSTEFYDLHSLPTCVFPERSFGSFKTTSLCAVSIFNYYSLRLFSIDWEYGA